MSSHCPPHPAAAAAPTPSNTAAAACCRADAGQAAGNAVPQTHPAAPVSSARLTTAATLHCLSGCAIGEFAGLAIGVTLGLDPWTTVLLATALGFASGYTLGLWPLVRRGMSWRAAFATLWLGETISIAAMELAMNVTDWHVGGVMATSLSSPMFWLGYGAALAAGFVVAWPVNHWLLRRRIKAPCH